MVLVVVSICCAHMLFKMSVSIVQMFQPIYFQYSGSYIPMALSGHDGEIDPYSWSIS